MKLWAQRLVLITLVVSAIVAFELPERVNAAVGETYSFNPSPGRIQELYAPGVALVLSVSNATVSKSYTFSWHVTDPSGATYSVTNTTTTSSIQTSFVIDVVFPKSFTGGSTKYVGNYTITVDQTSPTPKVGIQSGHFTVGLTDAPSYQRTFVASIAAIGYKGGDLVTMTMSANASPNYFSNQTFASSSGNVTFYWRPRPSDPVGNNTVSLQGASLASRKTPADIQSLTLYPTNVTISRLVVSPSSLQRTQMAMISFAASYPSNQPVQTGSGPIRITEADGIATHITTATYNPSLGNFSATFSPSLSNATGAYVATLSQDSFSDSYGNGGPVSNLVRGFDVQNASLTVSVSVADNVYGPGDIVAVYAKITSPDQTGFTSGLVTAIMTSSGQQEGSRVGLTYDPSQGKWVGVYTVPSSAPSGIWYATVQASDSYGNYGQSQTTVVVSVPLATAFLTNFWFLLFLPLVALGIASFVFWKRRKIFRSVLKVDLEAVSREAKKVENLEFFKKIQSELEQEEAERRK